MGTWGAVTVFVSLIYLQIKPKLMETLWFYHVVLSNSLRHSTSLLSFSGSDIAAHMSPMVFSLFFSLKGGCWQEASHNNGRPGT